MLHIFASNDEFAIADYGEHAVAYMCDAQLAVAQDCYEGGAGSGGARGAERGDGALVGNM